MTTLVSGNPSFRTGSEASAAGGRRSELSEWQRSIKIEGKRKPEDFIGYRNREAGRRSDPCAD